tara:strand:- start:910 stop:2397 length:1488 start_codon:yes stop_codon:yes gene_type:complete
MAEFFGFEIKRKQDEPLRPSFVPKDSDDGAGVIQSGGHFGAYIDIDGDRAKNDVDLILKYRDISSQPECDAAIEDIINEAIVGDHDDAPINIILDELEVSDKIKEMVREEFDGLLTLLNFNQYAHDIFRKWYVDGRLPYHIIIDSESPKAGIKELRYIDPIKLRKVKEVEEEQDPKTGAKLIKKVDEYFMYQDEAMAGAAQGLKIYPDAIAYCTSGIMDPGRKRILSYLQKALKPVNQLRMMEDSLVIYRISRAPERRIFYIDVGNLPKGKAEEYLRGIMNQYRNKLVYDAKTGDVKDDKKHMSMLEDFFLPRREGGRGTEITTLPGGENLGQIDDIIYFQKKLYRSLNVPINRLEQEAQFSLGRTTEISRDEVKFKKFVDRLRKRFSDLFMQLLKTQLLLKGIITKEDWKGWKESISFDFIEDNYFSELKQSEMIRERFGMLSDIEESIGKYVSHAWVIKNVLRFSDEEMEELEKQIEDEKSSGKFAKDDEEEF